MFPREGPKMAEKTKTKKRESKKQETEKQKIIIPPLDFSSLVLPFFTQALINLGLAEDPESKKPEQNLDLVKRLIDLLDLMKDRTQGNLKPEEKQFLDSCLHQLKLGYMEKTKIIKL